MKKILMLLAFAATVILSANAQEPQAPAKPAKVPAYRGIIERTQPNGYILRTFLRGDERKHFAATEDGWQIKEDKKGWLRYAKMNRKGDVVISFKVDKKGNIYGAEVTKSAGSTLDTAAFNIVTGMPRWRPGLTNGQPADKPASVTVSFGKE